MNVQGYQIEAANVQHGHDWSIWSTAKLPDDRVLMPGVICHATNVIEHPDTAGVQLIARDDEDGAIGFATVYWSYSTLAARAIGVMNDLYVAEAARGRGLGAELIGACEVECAARGIELLEWETAPDNARAQSVYDRFGATRSEWVSYTLPVSRR